jgi:ribosomal protein S6
MEYEICYLIGESNEGNLEKIKEEVKEIISQEGGKFLPEEKIEKRKMAYKVKKEIRGIYVAQRFETAKNEDESGNPIKDITGKLNLKNEVLRFMIVKTEELPPLVKKEEAQPEAAKKSEKKPESVSASSYAKITADKEKPKAKKDEMEDELDKLLNI